MSLLIIALVAGGLVAWWSERLGTSMPARVSLVTLLLTSLALGQLAANVLATGPDASGWLAYESHTWIPRFGIHFLLAMDGMSLLLVGLTLLLGVVAVIASWTEISDRPGFFQANLLWTLAGTVGVFLAMDLFLFFLFWEVMLVPMYLLIAIWGHEAKASAATKFFIFTQASGLMMLLGILTAAVTYADQTGEWSFAYMDWLQTPLTGEIANWVFWGFLLAFLVKLPAFPVHSWLPDAHTQAPTAGSVILAGVLLKTGAYGLLRFGVALFPESAKEWSSVLLVVGVLGVLYGAVLAYGQRDFKRLVAYSSISHMGFILLGVFAWNELAWSGAVLQMVAHGLSTAALFMIAGALQERLHTRALADMGGLWQAMPRMGAMAMFFVIASVGLPGLGNFIAEFLVLAGLWQSNPLICAIAALGLVTGAIYALWMLQQAFHGPLNERHVELRDFGARDMVALGLLAAGLLGLGLYPQPALDLVAPTLGTLALDSGGW
jgi:NADH-quinone oxidoreductase subunit M